MGVLTGIVSVIKGTEVSIVKELIDKGALTLHNSSVMTIVQSVYVPSINVSSVIVLFQGLATVVELVQDHQYVIDPSSLVLKV